MTGYLRSSIAVALADALILSCFCFRRISARATDGLTSSINSMNSCQYPLSGKYLTTFAPTLPAIKELVGIIDDRLSQISDAVDRLKAAERG